MLSFTLCLLALIVGYFTYGKFIERIMCPDDRLTPVHTKADGVDYVPLPRWKIFMIQFLNIAGIGPIFGAILGAQYGEASFLWIVLGSIFAGGVHDFTAAMLCMRHGGESMPETVVRYLGKGMGVFMRWFSIILLVLVTANFVANPAALLDTLTGGHLGVMTWVLIVFVYYTLAALLPIDKIIGKIYPLFAASLLFMVIGLVVVLYIKMPDRTILPELWDGLGNRHPQAATHPLFPMLFVSIACGAISGFHSTQSPIMCRCVDKERHAYPIFYGAMITEGIVALVWAAVTIWLINSVPEGITMKPAVVVNYLCNDWLGVVGGVLAVLGVIAAPITSGDTALRSARLVTADMLHIKQDKLKNRLPISLALYAVTLALLFFAVGNADGFNIIWRYFAWSNQTLATIVLWTVTVYLYKRESPLPAPPLGESSQPFGGRWAYLVTLIPAVFMTAVCLTYIFVAPEGIGGVFEILADKL